MFVIELVYKKSLMEIDKYLEAHRAFLQRHYDTGLLIVSGPKNPRHGGIIIARADNQDALEKIMQQDPFYQHDLADYRYTFFNPVKYCEALSVFFS